MPASLHSTLRSASLYLDNVSTSGMRLSFDRLEILDTGVVSIFCYITDLTGLHFLCASFDFTEISFTF